jgi:Flp pilus assembly pilin Flp
MGGITQELIVGSIVFGSGDDRRAHANGPALADTQCRRITSASFRCCSVGRVLRRPTPRTERTSTLGCDVANIEGKCVMRGLWNAFLRDTRGEDLIEYALLAAFAASIAVAAIVADPLAVKPALIEAFKRAKDALSNT